MPDKPLTNSEEKAVQAHKDGASRKDAFMVGHPIAKKWHPALLSRKADEFFDSDRVNRALATTLEKKTKQVKEGSSDNTKSSLTNKQAKFCEEYLVDLNGKQAAIRAGYSVKTAEQQASRLLSKVKVQIAIQEGMDKRSDRLQITVDEVLQELKQIGFATLEEDGLIKTSDKIRSLELLGRHLKMFTDKVEHTGKDEQPIEVINRNMTPDEAGRIYKESLNNG